MPRITWHRGKPPSDERAARPVLVIGRAIVQADALEDTRPSLYLAHYTGEGLVPARVVGMKASEARPTLAADYWAEVDLPKGVDLRPLDRRDFNG